MLDLALVGAGKNNTSNGTCFQTKAIRRWPKKHDLEENAQAPLTAQTLANHTGISTRALWESCLKSRTMFKEFRSQSSGDLLLPGNFIIVCIGRLTSQHHTF
jgi:hypothetical protein